jgi:hypothetical protein
VPTHRRPRRRAGRYLQLGGRVGMRPSITLQRHKEHDEIADSFDGRAFSRSEFKQRYQPAYPTRAPGSIPPVTFASICTRRARRLFSNFCGSPGADGIRCSRVTADCYMQTDPAIRSLKLRSPTRRYGILANAEAGTGRA